MIITGRFHCPKCGKNYEHLINTGSAEYKELQEGMKTSRMDRECSACDISKG